MFHILVKAISEAASLRISQQRITKKFLALYFGRSSKKDGEMFEIEGSNRKSKNGESESERVD